MYVGVDRVIEKVLWDHLNRRGEKQTLWELFRSNVRAIARIFWDRDELRQRCVRLRKVQNRAGRLEFEKDKKKALKSKFWGQLMGLIIEFYHALIYKMIYFS